MPSPGEDIQSWSVTAADNGTADPLINWVEGQTRASVNNSSRSEMAAHAKDRNLKNGSIVTTGTANAQAFLSGQTYTTIPTGLVVKLKVGSGLTNTSSVTLNMDGLGDTLVKTSNGSNLLGGELVSGCYTDFIYDGSNWIFLYSQQFIDDQLHGGGGVVIGKQIFSTPGTISYVPTPQTECCIIECVGAGGGGGVGFGAAGLYMIGAGGGSGGYSRTLATAAQIGASQTVTIGAGGAGGVPGASPFNNGQPGGDTSVGALCIAKGGLGGEFSASIPQQNGLGGAGGPPGTGDVTAAGAPGDGGFFNSQNNQIGCRSGLGGSSIMGGGAPGTNGGNGFNASNYGSGGSGGSSYDGVPYNGGAGTSGFVIITEFAGRGAPGRDGPQGPIGPPGPSGSGTGDVLVFGTPVAGQVAVWQDTSHITGRTFAFVLPNYLGGLTLANNGASPLSKLDIGIGGAASDDNAAMMNFSTAGFNKDCTATWTVGSGGGARDATGSPGLTASTWYHVFLMMRTDTLVVDVLVSISATAPILPSPYDKKRRIGSFKTNASANIIAFSQHGDEFLWRVPIGELNNVSVFPSLTTVLSGVPTGVKVRARLRGITTNNAGASGLVIVSPDESGNTALGSPAGNFDAYISNTNLVHAFNVIVRTNTLAQIISITSGGSTVMSLSSYGWFDERGK
jgi:hypothetical protein